MLACPECTRHVETLVEEKTIKNSGRKKKKKLGKEKIDQSSWKKTLKERIPSKFRKDYKNFAYMNDTCEFQVMAFIL